MVVSKFVDIPDSEGALSVSYLDLGESENILMCLHGIQGSKNSFEPLFNSVLASKLRILAPDLPGFGDSGEPKSKSYTLDDHAERLITFLDTLEIERLNILGHSLGGMLGTMLLQMVPDRIIRFINLEGNLRGQDCGETRRVAGMTFGQFKTERLPQLLETDDPYLKLGMQKVRPEAFFETAISIVEWCDSERLVETLTETEIPVLFVKSALGNFVTEPKGRSLRTFTVPEVNHFTMGRSPVLFEEVGKFLVSGRT